MLADEASHEQLISFFKTGTQLHYKKGESIIRPGDEPRGIYLITKGYVKAYSITKYGEENVLIIRRYGEIFPLIWAFTGLHRDVTYEAMSDVSLWRASRTDFIDYTKNNEGVMALILDMAIEAYRLHSERVNTLEYRTVKERLASFLLTHIERFGSQGEKGRSLSAPIRRSDIAASINASRESTSRELSALQKGGYIDLTTPYIEIIDESKLRALL